MFEEMTGQKIADELGITRQAVAQTIKRALGKLYKQYVKEYPEMTPFEIVAKIMAERQIEINKKNFNCFPLKIKKNVIKSAKDYAEERNYLIPQYK